jgi:hypothetical protein
LGRNVEAAEFQRILEIGLGRAITFLEEHDAAPYRDAILRACVHNMAYDPQVEGSRAQYMFEIVQRTGEEAFYRDGILAALMPASDEWDAHQLFDLARMFAQAGDERARQAMYDKFARDDTEEHFTGAEALIQLDGLPGLLYVANRIGETMLAGPDIWEDDYLVNVAEERCGKEEIRRALAEAQAGNPSISAYVNALEASRAQMAASAGGRRDVMKLGYDQIKQAIAEHGSRKIRIPLTRWGRQANEADVTRAAADLLAEEDDDRLVAYLRLFGRRRFPLDPGRLLNLTRHPNDRLAGAAFKALSQIADPGVRAFALDLLSDNRVQGDRKGQAVGLLISNYEAGDVERIRQFLVEARDKVAYHSIGLDVLDVFEAHPVSEAVPILRTLYQRGPCSNCRMRSVELLHALDQVPGWMLKECSYDANLDTRAMVAEWVRE